MSIEERNLRNLGQIVDIDQQLTLSDIQDQKPEWVKRIENVPVFMNTIQAILRWREIGVGNISSQTITPDLTQAHKRVWASLKAEQWVNLEKQLHRFASSGASKDSIESAQVSVYSHAAQLLLPYIDDEETFGAIVDSALNKIRDHPLPQPVPSLVPVCELWISG